MIWDILTALASGLFRLLAGRWFAKDPEKETLHADLEAKSREAEALAAPARSKRDIVNRLRSDEIH
jgi:hypothetical protein